MKQEQQKPEIPDEYTQSQINARIDQLRNMKARLLDEYGIFGGGMYVNAQHEKINKELESLGVQP